MGAGTIGIARKQRVFAVEETTEGTLQQATASTFIRPAGNAVMNQNPAFSDSLEIVDSLDVMDQFQDAMPAGDWSLPMYIRCCSTLGSAPQGDILWQSLQGSKNAATTASLSAALASTETTSLHIDQMSGGEFPEKGCVQVGSEYIYYASLTEDSTNSTATLGTLTRGYHGSSQASAADNADVTLKSVFYKQTTDTPSFSLWIETDHFTQGMSGCSVQQAVIGVTNSGGLMVTFTGGGMQMVWAGKDQLTDNTAPGGTTITVSDADRFSAGAYIQNITQGHSRASQGYEIDSVNTTTNVVTLSSAIEGAWATDDYIQGFIVGGSLTGDTIENKNTAVEIAGASAQFKGTDLTISTPKEYLIDEVGVSYPDSFLENVRSITSTLGLYFRQEDAKYFNEGYTGNEVTLLISFRDTNSYKRCELYMPKVKLEVPAINMAPPAIELNMPMKALGTSGEDSLEITFQ